MSSKTKTSTSTNTKRDLDLDIAFKALNIAKLHLSRKGVPEIFNAQIDDSDERAEMFKNVDDYESILAMLETLKVIAKLHQKQLRVATNTIKYPKVKNTKLTDYYNSDAKKQKKGGKKPSK